MNKTAVLSSFLVSSCLGGLIFFLAAPRAEAGPAFDELLRAAGESRTLSPVPQPPRKPAEGQPCLFDGRSGLPAPLEEALARAARSEVVYAGEKHDDARHHNLQAELISRLGAAAGFEMLYGRHQGDLDLYLRGALSEALFRGAVDWDKTWGFPFDLYRPVFEAVRAAKAAGAALNVPKAVVHKVAESGLESLTPQERREVPADFEATRDPAYLAMLRETFESHGGDSSDARALGRFVDAMSLWNEGMARHLVDFLKARPGRPVVVVAGAFHAYDAGMPASVARRLPGATQLSFEFVNDVSCPARLSAADLSLGSDYVWVVVP